MVDVVFVGWRYVEFGLVEGRGGEGRGGEGM